MRRKEGKRQGGFCKKSTNPFTPLPTLPSPNKVRAIRSHATLPLIRRCTTSPHAHAASAAQRGPPARSEIPAKFQLTSNGIMLPCYHYPCGPRGAVSVRLFSSAFSHSPDCPSPLSPPHRLDAMKVSARRQRSAPHIHCAAAAVLSPHVSALRQRPTQLFFSPLSALSLLSLCSSTSATRRTARRRPSTSRARTHGVRSSRSASRRRCPLTRSATSGRATCSASPVRFFCRSAGWLSSPLPLLSRGLRLGASGVLAGDKRAAAAAGRQAVATEKGRCWFSAWPCGRPSPFFLPPSCRVPLFSSPLLSPHRLTSAARFFPQAVTTSRVSPCARVS